MSPWVLSISLSFDKFFHVFLIKHVIFHSKTSESFKKWPKWTVWCRSRKSTIWFDPRSYTSHKQYFTFYLRCSIFLINKNSNEATKYQIHRPFYLSNFYIGKTILATSYVMRLTRAAPAGFRSWPWFLNAIILLKFWRLI